MSEREWWNALWLLYYGVLLTTGYRENTEWILDSANWHAEDDRKCLDTTE